MVRLPESLPARTVVLIALAAAVGLLIGGPPAAASASVAPAGVESGAGTWSDEFTGAAGAAPDPRKWGHDVGGNGWGNRELERYTTSTENAHLDGQGHLVILARKTDPGSGRGSCWYGPCRFTSARLLTLGKFSQQYGHFEARIQVPAGAGLWPAFWALDNNVNEPVDDAYAEADIMEQVGNEPRASYSSLHGQRGSASRSTCVGYTLPGRAAYSDAFHVFAADWSPGGVTFSVDGHRTATRSKASYGRAWTFDQPMFLILDLAVGGVWPGSPPPATHFPARMVVDYVRVTPRSSSDVAPPVVVARAGGCDRAR